MKDHWDLQWPKWMKRYRKLWTDKKNDNNSLYQHLTSCCISNIILLIKNQRKSESCPKRTHPSLLIQNAKYIPTLSADRRVQWCFRIWEVGRGRGNLNIVSCKINLLQICTQFFSFLCNFVSFGKARLIFCGKVTFLGHKIDQISKKN